jgi:hypothetical protein
LIKVPAELRNGMLEVPTFWERLSLMRSDISYNLCDLLFDGPPLLFLEFMTHLIILAEHVFELFNVDLLPVLISSKYFLENLLSLLVLIELYKSLHNNTDDKNVHEIIRH